MTSRLPLAIFPWGLCRHAAWPCIFLTRAFPCMHLLYRFDSCVRVYHLSMDTLIVGKFSRLSLSSRSSKPELKTEIVNQQVLYLSRFFPPDAVPLARQHPAPPLLHLRQSCLPVASPSIWPSRLWVSTWGYSTLSKDVANCDIPLL